jgi:hypothetical protein
MFQVIRPGSVKYIQYIASSDALFFGSCRRDFLRSKKKQIFLLIYRFYLFQNQPPWHQYFTIPLNSPRLNSIFSLILLSPRHYNTIYPQKLCKYKSDFVKKIPKNHKFFSSHKTTSQFLRSSAVTIPFDLWI